MNKSGNTIETQEVNNTNNSAVALSYIQMGFGLTLVILMFAIILYYFSSTRKNSVEEAKYDMMRDDDDEIK